MEKTNIKTKTYRLDDGFYLDIISMPDGHLKSYLHHEGNYAKMLIASSLENGLMQYDEFLKYSETESKEAIKFYKRIYID